MIHNFSFTKYGHEIFCDIKCIKLQIANILFQYWKMWWSVAYALMPCFSKPDHTWYMGFVFPFFNFSSPQLLISMNPSHALIVLSIGLLAQLLCVASMNKCNQLIRWSGCKLIRLFDLNKIVCCAVLYCILCVCVHHAHTYRRKYCRTCA